MKNIIHDCDPGVDDAQAILLALKSGVIKIVAITTVFGNNDITVTTNNTQRLLEHLRYDIPIGKGAARPLNGLGIKASCHGIDGMGDSSNLPKYSEKQIQYEAVELILSKIREGVRTIVATGPLTNIAHAFQKDRDTMNLLEELVIMGGSVREKDSQFNPEYNFYSDPYAADLVLNEAVRKVLIPLDVCRKVTLRNFQYSEIKGNIAAETFREISKDWVGMPLYDPLAMAYAIDPSFITALVPIELHVDTGYRKGICRERDLGSRHKTHVALAVDNERFFQYFINTLNKN